MTLFVCVIYGLLVRECVGVWVLVCVTTAGDWPTEWPTSFETLRLSPGVCAGSIDSLVCDFYVGLMDMGHAGCGTRDRN